MEDLIPLIIIIVSFLLSGLSKLWVKLFGKKDEAAQEEGADVNTVDRMLREMMHQAGFEEEQPVVQEAGTPGEHRRTVSEHRPTSSEHRPTLTERQPTASEHFRTAAETLITRSEHQATASERAPSPGEHVRGDAPVPPGFRPPPPTAHKRRRSAFGKALLADLRGGSRTLARAVVLREILGPPVSLKDS